MANINSHKMTSDEEEALYLASQDTIAFGKLFLEKDFGRSETPPFHYEVADILDDKSIKQFAIVMPRGHGKTVLTKANVLKEFCFADPDDPLFIGWVAATQKLTVGNMDYIKEHLEFNSKMNYYFGKLKGKKWTEEDIELSNGCKLLCKSNVSGIRGGAKLHKRYERIILDDFEDENNTITQDARDKNANLVTAVVHPALEPHTGRLHINGTPVHFDSFINRILVGHEQAMAKGEDFAWKVFKRIAIQEDGSALWPSWFPIAKLEEKKVFYKDSGMPDKFWQEYMMEVMSPEDAIFSLKHIKNWEGYYLYDPAAELGTLVMDEKVVPVNVFVGVDPATDVMRKNSDYSVLMVVAIDENNNHYVLEYISMRGLPVLGIPGEEKKGIVDYMFDLQDKYRPCLFTVEDTTMSRPIFQSIIAEKRRRNRFDMHIREEKPGTRMSKRDRIQGILAQKLSVGVVKIREEHVELRREILTFGPRMAHDDCVDALAYALKYTYVPKAEFNDKDKQWQRKRYDTPRSWIVA